MSSQRRHALWGRLPAKLHATGGKIPLVRTSPQKVLVYRMAPYTLLKPVLHLHQWQEVL